MANGGAIRLRDRRQPGHFWADNEVMDVFGSEVGRNGLSLYMVLARYSYGSEVRLSLSEMAEAAFMKKDTVARAMKVLVTAGLVIEIKARAAKSASSYALADVKALVKQREAAREMRELQPHDLSHGATDGGVNKKICAAQDETDLSQAEAGFETDLSQNAGLSINKKQDSKKQDDPPNPQRGARAGRTLREARSGSVRWGW